MSHGFALVEYDTIFADEAGTSKLREWFRVPPPGPPADVAAVTAAAAAEEGEYEVHPELSFQLRPKPPAAVRNCRPWPAVLLYMP
jgi:hypothetical protein